MPRRRSNGVRAGAPGQAYGNRTDLNAGRSLPVQTVPGQTYGAQVQQQNAQRIVPMGTPPLPMGQPTGAAPGQAGSPPPAPGGQSFLPPGSLTPLEAPTQRPNEPVTHGAALGPGPGPETLPQGANAMGNGVMSSLLQRAAMASGSSALRSLATQAAQQGR
jgi:hypothetical protein